MKRFAFILVGMVVVIAMVGGGYAAQSKKNSAFGTLTAFENRNTLAVIDDKGYIMSPKALIYDKLGNKVSIDELELPAPVYIEFSYAPDGVIVTLLKVTPR